MNTASSSQCSFLSLSLSLSLQVLPNSVRHLKVVETRLPHTCIIVGETCIGKKKTCYVEKKKEKDLWQEILYTGKKEKNRENLHIGKRENKS